MYANIAIKIFATLDMFYAALLEYMLEPGVYTLKNLVHSLMRKIHRESK